MPQTRELRVFISSTFRDLVEEREQLTKKVFPALRSLCRERGVEFTEIDLRWGLTDEEAHNGKIIRTCFEEIDACRPYFIGIIGSRYGWVPSFSEIQKDPLLVKRFPWVEDAALDGMSILEMEFNYAALRNPTAAENTFFYLRRDRPLSHRFSSVSENVYDSKLEHLRKRVRESGLPCKEYSGAETLGEMIYDDLLAVIERIWPQEEESVLDRERFQHAAFATSRRHAYIANPERIRHLTKLVRDEHLSVVIEAPSGSGKSALLAYWSHHFRENDANAFVIEHYVGAGNDAADASSIATRIIREIIERYELSDEQPPKSEDCPAQLPFWLARVTEPCIVVLDAVNQLDESSRTLGWIPEQLPPEIQFVVSTTDTDLAASLSKRGWAHETLDPLTQNEREAIIVRYLNEYHKSLSLEQSIHIASDPKCSSPLFLRTMLEELRLVGTHKHLDSIIERYLTAKDTDALFQLVLERLEEDFGARTVRELMSFIWASRHGLSQRELGELMPITHMKLSTLLLALDYHLQRQGGLLTFFHEYLRRAVKARYIKDDTTIKEYYVRLGQYMSQQPFSARRVDEELWQWHKANEWQYLKAALLDKDNLAVLSQPEKIHELSRYWRDLEQHEPADAKDDFLYPQLEQKERWAVISHWAKFFEYYGNFQLASELFEYVIDELRVLPEQKLELAEALDGVSSVYYELGNFDKAEIYLKEAISIKEQLLAAEDIATIKSYSNLGAITYAKGNPDEAIAIFQKCVELCKEYLGVTHHETAVNLNNLATLEYSTGKNEEALKHFIESLAIFEKHFGAHHPTVGRILENIGTVYQLLENYEQANKILQRALNIFTETLPERHPQIAKVKNILGIVEHNQERYDRALEYFNDALTIVESNYGKNRFETLNTMLNIARAYFMKKEFRKSSTLVNEVSILLDDKTISNAGFLRQNILNKLNNFSDAGYEDETLTSIRSRIEAQTEANPPT